MKHHLKIIFYSCGLLIGNLTPICSQAQAPGSQGIYGGPLSTVSVDVGGFITSPEETLYLGPGIYTIDGTWEIYSKYIVIDPEAIITGSGSIQIYDPLNAGAVSSRTFIDGNGSSNAIDVNVVFNNASGIELDNKDFPSDLTDLGGFTNSPSSSAYFGRNLDLAVDGADIWLDADAVGDLHFDNNATISNYGVTRMVITNNSIISHVVRDAGNTGFFFPVGIADGDYTPANIVGDNKYYVSVQDYSASASVEVAPMKGMDRTWHIYGGTATSVALQHNSPATDGTSYVDDNAFITRYLGSGSWTTGTAEQTSTGLHTNSGDIGIGIPSSPDVDASLLTKASDPSNPLPVKLVSFTGKAEISNSVLNWVTATEVNFSHFEVEYSGNGIAFKSIGYVEGGGSKYSFTYPQPDHIGYYRLKMMDLDGKSAYSRSVSVTLARRSDWLEIFPNPTENWLNVKNVGAGSRLELIDASGRQLISLNIDTDGPQSIQIEKLPAGMYYLIVQKDAVRQISKVIKN